MCSTNKFAIVFRVLTVSLVLSLNAAFAFASEVAAPIKLKYCSVFSQYQAFNDQAVAPWRDSNDAVAKIGGWRAYAKQMMLPDPKLADKPADCAQPRKQP